MTKKVTQIYTRQKKNPWQIGNKLKVPQIYSVYKKKKKNKIQNKTKQNKIILYFWTFDFVSVRVWGGEVNDFVSNQSEIILTWN